MADWMERKRMEKADNYNRGFNAGYEAGKKAAEKEEEEKLPIDEEQAKIDPYKNICTG